MRRNLQRSQIRNVGFERVFPELERARLTLEPCSRQFGVRYSELVYLAFLAQRKPGMRIFEFGTGAGRTTLNMALNLAPDGQIITLDLPDQEVLPDNLVIASQKPELDNKKRAVWLDERSKHLPITALRGDSTTMDLQPYYRTMDLVFVDGNHSLDGVKADTRNAFAMLKDAGGIIVWHDYWNPSTPAVNSFLNELSAQHALYLLDDTKSVLYASEPEIVKRLESLTARGA